MARDIDDYTEDKVGDAFSHVCGYSKAYVGSGITEIKYYLLPGKHIHWFAPLTLGLSSVAVLAADALIAGTGPNWRNFYFKDDTGELLGRNLDSAKQILLDREKAVREEAAKEEAARQQAAREQAAKEEAAREQAAREQAAREKLAREQAAREKLAREQAAKEEEAREKAAREVLAREQAAREQAAREQAAKEEAAREQAAREAAAREQAAREQAAKEEAAREAAAREQAAREQAAREQAAREQVARTEAEQARVHLNDGLEIINDNDADIDDKEEANNHFNHALDRFQAALQIHVLYDIRESLEELIDACRQNGNFETVERCIETLRTYYEETQHLHDLADDIVDPVGDLDVEISRSTAAIRLTDF